jgi:hypothetical protein
MLSGSITSDRYIRFVQLYAQSHVDICILTFILQGGHGPETRRYRGLKVRDMLTPAAAFIELSLQKQTLRVLPVLNNEVKLDQLMELAVWRAHWSEQLGDVLILGSPCFMSSPPSVSVTPIPTSGEDKLISIEGTAQCTGQIAFIPRGNHIPLYQLALVAQQQGAIAAVIIDHSHCQRYDQSCIPGANRHLNEGFAAQDIPAFWLNLRNSLS